MLFAVDGKQTHALTGGLAFDASLPTVVFLHGAGMDATVWALQSRWFAHHGFGVLALDFPGHGRSDGAPLPAIVQMADWVAHALDALGVGAGALVGHSMGSLVAMAAAARHERRVTRVALIGTALAMKVGPDLLAAAAADSPDAVTMVNLWSHAPRAGLGQAEMPGFWMAGAGKLLLRRAGRGVLSSDLQACNAFAVAELAAHVTQPTLILQGSRDMMTPLKGAHALARLLPNARLEALEGAGHMTMVEEGGAVLTHLAAFLAQKHGHVSPTLTQPVGAPP